LPAQNTNIWMMRNRKFRLRNGPASERRLPSKALVRGRRLSGG
jgi:hypothetical protein